MTIAFRNIGLLGATGNLGSKILQALNDAGFSVTAIQRKGSTKVAAGVVKSILVDLSSSSDLVSAFKDIDVVISAVPNPHLDTEKIVIDAAISAGVKRFVPSEYSSNLETEAAKSLPIITEKINIRRYIEEVAAANKIEWTSVNNGPFLVPSLWISGFVGPNVKSKAATYHDGGNRLICTTALERIAEGVVKALHPENEAETKNKPVYVYSAVVSEKKLTQLATKITGIQFTEQESSIQDAIKTGYEGVKEGNQTKMMSFYIPFMFGEAYKCDFRDIAWNDRFGLETMDDAGLEETIRGWLK
ncbi:hypothetical protein V492_06240 [Pseudogymnoascus sp. VKM F-4246]|nr:hypothetical protein V492_06240 [Pseudogymnoascus sp. VKM F-4246]